VQELTHHSNLYLEITSLKPGIRSILFTEKYDLMLVLCIIFFNTSYFFDSISNITDIHAVITTAVRFQVLMAANMWSDRSLPTLASNKHL
jgi:hypothetical protein